MNTEKWLVIGKDERLKQLAKKLTSPERSVFYKHTDIWDISMNATVLDFFPNKIVLPILPMQVEVPMLLGTKQVQFYAGRLNEHWQVLLKNAKVSNYLQDESFIWKNAALTAEGLLAYFYEKGISVQDKVFIVTGFGRVAKMIAQVLESLHAKVYISVRSKTQQTEARVYGYPVISLQPNQMVKADALINTIPAQWLTQPFSEQLNMPIFDLASAPGCLYYVSRADYQLLSSLPGKYFPEKAAQILYETITDGGD